MEKVTGKYLKVCVCHKAMCLKLALTDFYDQILSAP